MKNQQTFPKHRVLFICLGNICRSPAAEGIMQHIVDQRGLSNQFLIDSAGIGSWHIGQLPDKRMRSHGADHGYDFSSRARQFSRDDFQRFDYIVTMDEENYYDIIHMAHTDDERAKVVKMANFLKNHPHQMTVPDPYYGGDKGFEFVIELLEDGCSQLLESILHKVDITGIE